MAATSLSKSTTQGESNPAFRLSTQNWINMDLLEFLNPSKVGIHQVNRRRKTLRQGNSFEFFLVPFIKDQSRQRMKTASVDHQHGYSSKKKRPKTQKSNFNSQDPYL